MKKILVSGSCGFIFSNFIRKILYERNDIKLISVDKIVDQNTLYNIYVNNKHNFNIGDVADAHFIDTVFLKEKPDIVIHGAAESFVDAAIGNATPFIHSNALGTQVIADACVKHKVGRLIYISTDEVYGQLTSEDQSSWTEDSPLNPRNPYSASKAAGEMIVKAAHYTHGLNYNITRSCNNMGPRQAARNFIPKVINNILNNQEVPIYGEGKQLREWIHVEDNCSAIMKIIDSALPNETYNISTGYEISNIELFQEICNVIGRGYDLVKFVKDRPGHDFRYRSEANKLKELGWTPNFKFKQALASTCNWYQENKWFLNKVKNVS